MQYEQFTESMYNMDMNKVLILSSKRNISEDFKAISSEYRDRLLFGFVPSNVHEVHSVFDEAVATKPEVIVYMSYDPQTNSTLQTGKRIQLNETHFSYAAMKEFLS